MNFNKCIKIIILFFSVFFLWNYGPFYFTKEEREGRKRDEEEKKARDKYTSYVNEISHAFGKKMLEKFQLVPSGLSGMSHRKIEMLGMEFKALRRATLDEARGLQLIAMDQFVKAINAHEKIYPFLNEKPFSPKSIMISIIFEGRNGYYYDGSIARIVNIYSRAEAKENKHRLIYYAADPYENTTVELLNESYEEALKIFLASEEFNPYEHEANPLEEVVDRIYVSFVEEMKNKYDLNCFSIGARMPEKVEEIGGNFCLVKHTSQEDARKLLLAMTGRLIEIINLSQELRPYLIEHPFPTNRFKLKISFTKSDNFPYFDGSMDNITLENNKITYFKIPPEDRLVRTIPFHEENYEEARNILENRKLLPSLLLTEAK